jgi:hypothetical protein
VKRAVSRRRIETPKNHLQRRIDLSDELARVLQDLHRHHNEEWFRKGKPVPEWVFCNEEGNYLNNSISGLESSIRYWRKPDFAESVFMTFDTRTPV